MSRFIFCTAACLFLANSAALVSAATADEISACKISAWVKDNDPAGLNVRAGASRDAAIIGQLPLIEAYFPAEVSITGSKDGWFRVDRAVLDDYTGAEPEVVFEGEGWVSGRLLGLLLNIPDLHTEPSLESPVVAHLFYESPEGNLAGSDSFIVTSLLACQGDWVQVDGTFIDTHLTGWTTRTCANQVTTCP